MRCNIIIAVQRNVSRPDNRCIIFRRTSNRNRYVHTWKNALDGVGKTVLRLLEDVSGEAPKL